MHARSIAIETATDVCSVALAEDGEVRAVASIFIARIQAERLVPLIQSIVEHSGWSMPDLHYVAVSTGPGSYTGLRIGLSTAKGLAYSLGAGIVGVSTLEAFAMQAVQSATAGDVIIPSFDARRSDVYAAAYRVAEDRSLTPVLGPAAEDAQQFAAQVAADTLWLLGDGTRKLEPFLAKGAVQRRLDLRPSAATVAALAHRRWEGGDDDDLATLEPAYMREFVAKKPVRSAFEKLAF